MSNNNSSTNVGKYITKIKNNLSLWDDFIGKSQKLSLNLKGTSNSLISFADSLSIICNSTNSDDVNGLKDIMILLNNICNQQKIISEKFALMSSSIQNNLVNNVGCQIDFWKRSALQLKKERDQDYKKAKSEYKRSKAVADKAKKKLLKRSETGLMDSYYMQADYADQDLLNKTRFLEDLERCSLRRAVIEERKYFSSMIDNMRPLLDNQLELGNEMNVLEEIYGKLYVIEDCSKLLRDLPPEVEFELERYHGACDGSIYSGMTVDSGEVGGGSGSGSCSGSHNSLNEINKTLTLLTNSFNDGLDTSTSTIRDLPEPPDFVDFNDGLTNGGSEVNTADVADENDESSLDNSQVSLGNLYPNQVMPPPRYTNIKQLKLDAERKYGLSSDKGVSNTLTRRSSVSIDSGCGTATMRDSVSSSYQQKLRPYSVVSEPDEHVLEQAAQYFNDQTSQEAATPSGQFHMLPSFSHYATSTFQRPRNSRRVIPMDTPTINAQTSNNGFLTENRNLRSYNVTRRASSFMKLPTDSVNSLNASQDNFKQQLYQVVRHNNQPMYPGANNNNNNNN